MIKRENNNVYPEWLMEKFVKTGIESKNTVIEFSEKIMEKAKKNNLGKRLESFKELFDHAKSLGW